jgi:two-component system OmpR family sensor kinase/two-component system sensor histidine kinase BaeS
MGLVFLALFILTFLTSVLAIGLLSGAFQVELRGGLVIPSAFVTLALLWILSAGAFRAVRRVAVPLDDVMDAADRVAAGDYEARITERGPRDMRRLARRFNQMAERLAAAEEQRRDLLADVAHELRTPLSVIQGDVEGMLDRVYPTDPEHLEPLLEETRVMARLLEDLRTLSTAEAGALRLEREEVDPRELVVDAVDSFRPQAEAAGVSLEGRADPGLPSLAVDPIRIGQVLANLLHNAVRHTPRGESIRVTAEPIEEGRSVAFSVEDAGPGIDPDALPHVFDRFVKSADSGGAGLGLAIARSLVEAHEGTIAAENVVPHGARVRFVLPVAE